MDLEARILELEQELAALKATQLCSNCRRPVAATAPRAPVVPAPRPVSSSPHLAGTAVRPAMPKSSPQQVLPAPPLQPIQAAPPAHLLPPPVALVPNLPPVVQTRAGSGERLHTPLAARRKSLVPDNGAEGQQPGTLPVPLNSSGSMPLLPPLSLGQMASEDSHLRHSTNMPGQRPSLSARAARSGSVIDFVAPSGSRSARQDSVGSGSDSPFHRSPRDSVVINQHEEVDWSLFSCEGTMISVTQMRLTSDAAVQEALGAGHKLFLTVASAHGDAKSQWFLVRAAVAGPGGAVKCAWTLPRYYGSFQTLAKSLVGVVTNELPKIKASVNEGERVLVLNAYLMDLCTQLGCGSLALMRFADPFDSPSTLSLRTMQPIHEGMLELALPKGGGGGGFLKSQAYHFILTEHLCYFKTLNDETAAGIISLDYVTIDMVVDSAFPRFSFAICNLQKETLAVLSADSTKSLSEWILRIRKGKFLRTGISYGVAAGSPQEEKAAASVPKNAATKELFAAYLNSGTLPAGATLNTIDLNPMKWKPVADAPDCVVIAEGTLKEAAPQKLVEKALDNQLSSTNLAVTFMTTFRYYLKPVEFFPYFLRAWMAVKPGSETQLSQIRLLLILKQWLAFHFCDFCDNLELARWFLVFFHQHLNSGPHAAVFQKYTAVLLDLLKENALPIAPSNGGPNTMLPAVFSKEHIEIIDLNSLEIARQLTLYSFGLFSAIAPNELMFQRWNTAEKEVSALLLFCSFANLF